MPKHTQKVPSGEATTMEKLPGEVLSEIFTRLLAKQLAQMRSVSKSLNAFLSHPYFIKSHLSRSIQNNDEVLLFSGLSFSFGIGPSPFRPRFSRSPEVELTNFIKLPVIPQSNFGFGHVIGSVNGLICFSYLSSVFDGFILHIWNPSLSALLSLPPCPLRSSGGRIELGFGYDPINEDYKIVKLTPNIEPQGEVYSMRKNSWNLISQSLPSRIKIIKGFNKQVYVNGHVHWICDTDLEGNPQVILAFDLVLETFSQIPLPDVVHKCSNHFGVMGEKLCVMSKDGDGGAWDMWVMNEYGVAESWVKHPLFPASSLNVTPYGCTSHGGFLVQAGQEDRDDLYELRFGLSDLVAGKVKDFKIMLNSNFSKVVEYVDSLVWVAPPAHES